MPIPANEPADVWTNKTGEYTSSGPFLLADASGKLLADASNSNLIDSGIIVVPLPPTVWLANDGV